MSPGANFGYGLASHDRVAAMTGKQFLQAIIEGEFPQAPISQALTFWIVEVGDGFAAFEGESGPHLLNPMGTVHGGWALTLIDSGRFHFANPSAINEHVTIESEGTINGETGEGTYTGVGTPCQGSYRIRLVQRLSGMK
jgi:hypothetical protein